VPYDELESAPFGGFSHPTSADQAIVTDPLGNYSLDLRDPKQAESVREALETLDMDLIRFLLEERGQEVNPGM
jgi:hypothetical protein